MADRESLLHVAVVVGAFAVYAALVQGFDIALRSRMGLVLAGAVNVVFLGGLTQAILAARGHSGGLPTIARWRYVLAVIAFSGIVALPQLLWQTRFPASVGMTVFGVGCLVIVGYFAVEIRAGYRDSIDQ